MEKTLVIIKPDGINHAIEIVDMIYANGLTINMLDVTTLNEDIIAEHYAHLINKPFYPKLKEYMLSGQVVTMILEGENAVAKFRELMGPTDSTLAPKDTIRGKFGKDITYNVVHGSDSIESAKIEIERFFPKKIREIVENKCVLYR